jgi:hypothetical protein
MIQPNRNSHIRETPLARAFIDNLGGKVTHLSSQVLYRKGHPEYTSENTRDSDKNPLAIDVIATNVTIEFPGTRYEMLKRLRGIGIKSEDIGGPFREEGSERYTYFQAPFQDSGIHQTGITILCQSAKF